LKQDTQAAKDYTYEKKDEYKSRLEYQMQELDAKTEELKGKAANASESVKREFDKDMSELSRQKARAQSKSSRASSPPRPPPGRTPRPAPSRLGLRQAHLRARQGPLQ